METKFRDAIVRDEATDRKRYEAPGLVELKIEETQFKMAGDTDGAIYANS